VGPKDRDLPKDSKALFKGFLPDPLFGGIRHPQGLMCSLEVCQLEVAIKMFSSGWRIIDNLPVVVLMPQAEVVTGTGDSYAIRRVLLTHYLSVSCSMHGVNPREAASSRELTEYPTRSELQFKGKMGGGVLGSLIGWN
jgi:hypothetical protein